jgi:phospholipid/cholesterol/gamma-HCH transport system substrate-binding protein
MSRTLRLGTFIVAALLILAAAIFLIGSNQLKFQSTFRVKADFANVAGLNGGADVRIAGIHEGTVRKIDLPKRPDEKVTVEMDLKKNARAVVKKDSVASIESEGLVGDKYVEISFGSPEAQKLSNGETISSAPPVDISDVIKKANEILDTSKGAVENIEATSDSLKSIGAKIDQGQGTVGKLINDKTVYQEASAGATALQENMEALKHNFLLRGFYQKRGYEDASELTQHEISRLPAAPEVKTFEYDSKQLFDKSDSAKLKNQKVLDDAGRFLHGNQFGLAVVTASTGAKGDSEKARVLSEAQTMVVRKYLVDNFPLDDLRIKTMGIGKTEAGGENGKVEIVIYPPGTSVPAPAKKLSAKSLSSNP